MTLEIPLPTLKPSWQAARKNDDRGQMMALWTLYVSLPQVMVKSAYSSSVESLHVTISEMLLTSVDEMGIQETYALRELMSSLCGKTMPCSAIVTVAQ